MPTRPKIKINDSSELRKKLVVLYDKSPQLIMARWSIELAKHIMEIAKYNPDNIIIQNGFFINEAWQSGDARMHDVRQTGFKIHTLARASDSILHKTVLRVVGHAVASGHMKEHAMVASDYSIKVINLLFPANIDAVINERERQILCLEASL